MEVMKYEKQSMDGLFSIYEIAKILNTSVSEIFRIRENLSISPSFKKGNSQFYRVEQFQLEGIFKYYPMKTTETFYIYESKMNN